MCIYHVIFNLILETEEVAETNEKVLEDGLEDISIENANFSFEPSDEENNRKFSDDTEVSSENLISSSLELLYENL